MIPLDKRVVFRRIVENLPVFKGDNLDFAAEKPLYETAMFSVCRVPHLDEDRYGFHFKDTDEFGLYMTFYDDNNECYERFYRSNAGFDTETCLHDIRVDEPPV